MNLNTFLKRLTLVGAFCTCSYSDADANPYIYYFQPHVFNYTEADENLNPIFDWDKLEWVTGTTTVYRKYTEPELTFVTRLGMSNTRLIDGTYDFDQIAIDAVNEVAKYVKGVKISAVRGTPGIAYIGNGISEIYFHNHRSFDINFLANTSGLLDTYGNILTNWQNLIGKPVVYARWELDIAIWKYSNSDNKVTTWNSYRNRDITYNEYNQLQVDRVRDIKREIIAQIVGGLGLGPNPVWEVGDKGWPILQQPISAQLADQLTVHDAFALQLIYGQTGLPLPGPVIGFKGGTPPELTDGRRAVNPKRQLKQNLRAAIRANNTKKALRQTVRLARRMDNPRLVRIIRQAIQAKNDRRQNTLIKRAIKLA